MSKKIEVDFDVLDGAMTQWRKERGEVVTGRRARNSNTMTSKIKNVAEQLR